MTSADLTLISGGTFVTQCPSGEVLEPARHGLFTMDTRHLSRYTVYVNGSSLDLLGSEVTAPDSCEMFLANSGSSGLPGSTVQLPRRQTLGESFSDRFEIRCFADEPIDLLVRLEFAADFADIFEIRGLLPAPEGREQGDWTGAQLVLRDRRRPNERKTRIRFDPVPDDGDEHSVTYRSRLGYGESISIQVDICWEVPEHTSSLPHPVTRSGSPDDPRRGPPTGTANLDTDDPVLERVVQRAIHDLRTLDLPLSSGDVIPAAGVPWYLTIFGRDSILASYQALMLGPGRAAGTLRTLAAYQSFDDDPGRDAESGKMPHEIRFGEAALSGAIPHARYYGTVDATLLWMMLLAETLRWTNDRSLAADMRPSLERALVWMSETRARRRDGFIGYRRRAPGGLRNQGWKDSEDSIRFADGSEATGSIALVEVQGYCYAALESAAFIFDTLGMMDRASSLRSDASEMQSRIHDAFWMPRAGYYALAVDGEGRQVDSVTSNPAHLLWCGAVVEPFAGRVVERLMADDMNTGWGVRTMASSMRGYNPMSYHNGSIWPHDNAIAAAGLARYGYHSAAMTVIDAMFDAAKCFPLGRLPELFCGNGREETTVPVPYPVACSPQAWAASAVISMVQTLAGIRPQSHGLASEPLRHGRRLKLCGIPFQGARVDLDAMKGSS